MKQTNPFYGSPAWKDCREAYKAKVHGLCELCLASGVYTPGEIVHHKIKLNAKNIDDPSVTLNFDNLQLVCREHHAQIHAASLKRYKVDEFGKVQTIGD